MLPAAQARRVGRYQAVQAVTLALALGYGLGALVFAPSSQRVAFDWLSRFEYRASLGVTGAAGYLSAWLYGGWAGVAILRKGRRAPWVGAAYGVLTLLTATLAGSSWNFAQQAIRLVPFPGTTAAELNRYTLELLEDYVGKPLAWVLLPGSLPAALLGGWFGSRVKSRAKAAGAATA